ncbi:hypothetical protein AAAC51_04740 [Priestia megaterium]
MIYGEKQLVLISIITAAFFVLIFHKTIFQEGNPLPIAWSIVKLKSSGEDVVQISDKPKRYLIHSDDYLTFIKQMKKKKVNFQYQDDKNFILITTMNASCSSAKTIPISSRLWN